MTRTREQALFWLEQAAHIICIMLSVQPIDVWNLSSSLAKGAINNLLGGFATVTRLIVLCTYTHKEREGREGRGSGLTPNNGDGATTTKSIGF